jgi:hypothetical protein
LPLDTKGPIAELRATHDPSLNDRNCSSPRTRVARQMGTLEITPSGDCGEHDIHASAEIPDSEDEIEHRYDAQITLAPQPRGNDARGDRSQPHEKSPSPTSPRKRRKLMPSGSLNTIPDNDDDFRLKIMKDDQVIHERQSARNNPASTLPRTSEKRSFVLGTSTKSISLAAKDQGALDTAAPTAPKSPNKSPPLSSTEISPLYWHDSEITGHDPTDPADDGTGINGLGFRPTAAKAWSLSEQRKKAIAEWRTREAREARNARGARRKRGFDNEEDALHMAVPGKSVEGSPRKAVRVHFEDR